MTPDMDFISNKIAKLNEMIKPCTLHEDGRCNSLGDEESIIEMLRKHFGEKHVVKPRPRFWYDVLFFGIPLQIKSSSFSNNAADNFSSKRAILWALTDMTIEEVSKSPTAWKKFDETLFSRIDDLPNRDYHILVFDKDTKQLHIRSLRTLQSLTANGSNLPFQINWQKNLTIVKRDFEDAKDFILSGYRESASRAVGRHKGILSYGE